MTAPTKLKPHRFAALFQPLHPDELKQLADDIQARGLQRPIVLYDGLILDGRNRYRACEIAGVEPQFTQFEGTEDDALGFVMSENLYRRHLSTSQRSAIAARVASLTGVPQEKAAAAVNVSERNVQKANKVALEGVPELTDALVNGNISVAAAKLLADLPKDRQAEIVAAGPEEMKRVAAEIRGERRTATAPEPAPPVLDGDIGTGQPARDRALMEIASALSKLGPAVTNLATIGVLDAQHGAIKQAVLLLRRGADELENLLKPADAPPV